MVDRATSLLVPPAEEPPQQVASALAEAAGANDYKYRAFISYSHRDSGWASWLHGSLERYRPPKPLIGTVTERGAVPKRLHPIFRDRDELASATDLGTLINAALAGSACQIVICSPAAARSKWVNEEIMAFKRLGREDRIFCLIVSGEPNASDLPGREDEECFPPALRFCLGPDGALSSVRTEPIAADARPGRDGKVNAKLKLIAGLLGVGFDALKRREQQRRNRRLFAFSCAALVGMLLTSGLAVYALYQRAAAQRETVRAEAEAATATATTKFLIDLFKVSDPGEARGNTITAREMLDKGAARVDAELAAQPAIQARLMDTLGTVYMGLGLYPEARPLLDRAVDRRRQLANIDPIELSTSLSHEGDVLSLQAEYDAAEKAYRDAIRIATSRPGDRKSQAALANSLYGLGTTLAKNGRYGDAEKCLREALALQQTLYGASNPDVARSLKDLARAVSDGGDLRAGIPIMQRAVDMQRALRGAEPHPDLSEVLNDMGDLLQQNGDLDGAERYFREALTMKRRLLGERHPEIAAGLENLASVLQDKESFAEAERLYKQSIDMNRELLGPNHPEIANTIWNLASLQYDRGETQEALANALQVLSIWRNAYPPDHPRIAFALNVIGFWQVMAAHYSEADHYLQLGLAMRRRLFGDNQPDVASSLMHVAILRDAEGQYAEGLRLALTAKDIYTNAFSANHWRTAIAESAEGAALCGLGRYAEAEAALNHSYAILKQDGGAPFVYRKLALRYMDALHRHKSHLTPPSPAVAKSS